MRLSPNLQFRARSLPLAMWVFFLALALVPAARAGLPVHDDPRLEAKVDSLVRAAVAHVYRGRLDRGLETIAAAEAVSPRDPRVGLTRYRLLRENYPVSVYQKERARVQAPALLAELDRTIAWCDSVLDRDETSAVAYLYRGWAYINQAQTHLIARHLRAAAGASRHGKHDFDRFYEYHPAGDPDAATVLGSYLFFADTLPGFFKFIRWLIRVPGGDRERGLELIRLGAAGDGYTSRDARMILGVVYYLFDGNLEEARPILWGAVGETPDYPWLVEYTSSMSFVYPRLAPSSLEAVNRVLEGWGETTVGWDGAIQCRMEWRRARLLAQLGAHDRALDGMGRIVDEQPPRAPWLLPVVRTAAMETAGRLGRARAVERWCADVPETRKHHHDSSHIRRSGDEPECPPVASISDTTAFVALGRARALLYSGRVEEAAALAAGVDAARGGSLESRYLAGEIARIAGRGAEAVERFESLEADAEDVYESSSVGHTWVRDLRVQTLLQLGELFIEYGEFERAEDAYKEAEDAEPEITLYANLIRGRLRYIERARDAAEDD